MLKHRPPSKDADNLRQYSIQGSLNLQQIEELDPGVPLRIAAVRNKQILHSEVISLADRQDRKIDFDLDFAIPGRPCGLTLMVGRADIREAELLAAQPLQLRIAATDWSQAAAQQTRLVANIGEIVLTDPIYRPWLVRCRTYTIRGRVVCRGWRYDNIEQQWVFQDAPAPGATVEIYDVDCWLWFCFKDLIGTAITDPDGTFEFTFRWCCRPWLFYPVGVAWQLNPDILRRVRELLRAKLPIGPILPDPPPDPIQVQDYLSRLVGSPEQSSPASARRSDAATTPALTAERLRAVLPPAPDLEALHIWPWWTRRDCTPDVVFRVTQPCEGDVQVIYEESTAQTRWNISQTLDVTLEANENACCLPEQPEPPCGDCLGITMVGCTTVDNIGLSAGPPDLRGYAYPGTLDRPFGGSVIVRGEFGEDSHPILDFYQVEYRKEGMPPGVWVDAHAVPGLMVGIARKYLDASVFPPPFLSPGVSFGPADFVGDGDRYYMTKYKYQRDHPDPIGGWIWTNPDWLFRVDSTRLPQGDGLYEFRVIGYRQDTDGSLVDARVMPICVDPNVQPVEDASVTLRIDNRVMDLVSTPGSPCGPGSVTLCTSEPHVDIVSVVRNEGSAESTAINACDFATIANDDTVTVHFRVTVPTTAEDGHLLAYEFSGHYGDSGLFNLLSGGTLAGDTTPEYGPTYAQAVAQGAPRPFWYGGNFKVTMQGSAFPVSCAYLLRLRAWKRTFRGCDNPYHFHWNVAEFSFCVIKPTVMPG